MLLAGSVGGTILSWSCAVVLHASTYEAAFDTGHQGLQVRDSPTPVALTNSESFHDDPFGSGIAAAIGAGGPGLANGVSNIVMSTDPDILTGRTGWGVSASAHSTFDGIMLTGPPDAPPDAIVEYSINFFVTAEMQASRSGAGRPYGSADGRVRWGTGSSLGFVSGVELGAIHIQGDGIYSATGVFSSVTADQPRAALGGGVSPSFMARNGDAISVTLQVETSAGAGDDRPDYGMGGAHMAAKASMQVTLTGVNVFNFSTAGWTANSQDGKIVNNQWVGPPNQGDFDGNQRIDGDDFLVWQRTLGTLVERGAGADGNGNGYIEFDDVSSWRSHFGEGSANARAVPEPRLGALAFALACLTFAHWRLRTLAKNVPSQPY